MTSTNLINNFRESRPVSDSQPSNDLDATAFRCKLDFRADRLVGGGVVQWPLYSLFPRYRGTNS